MASICTERRDCRSHRSPSSIDHHLLPSLSHLRTSSEAWRRSSSPQGTLQLRQIVSGTPPWPYVETSSRSSTWQVNRPAQKKQQPPTCWSMEAGYQAWSKWKSDATVQRLRDWLPDLAWVFSGSSLRWRHAGSRIVSACWCSSILDETQQLSGRDIWLDEVKQTTVEPWYGRAFVVHNQPSSASTADHRTASRCGRSRPSEVCPWPGHLHGHVDTPEMKGVALQHFDNYVRSTAQCCQPRSSLWWPPWCCPDWTMEALCWLALWLIWYVVFNTYWMWQQGSSTT